VVAVADSVAARALGRAHRVVQGFKEPTLLVLRILKTAHSPLPSFLTMLKLALGKT
jgi:hypothetical protein